MKSLDQYMALYHEAQGYWQPRQAEMAEVQRAYNDEVSVPLPELDKIEKSAVPNLLQQAANHMADNLASVMPSITVEPLGSTQIAEERARRTSGALRWWMKKSGYQALIHQRAFYLPAYGLAPALVIPDAKLGFSRFETRNPLSSLVCPPASNADLVAPWAFFRFSRTLAWWNANHPDAVKQITKSANPKATDLYEGLEFFDDKERSVFLVGKVNPFDMQSNADLQPMALVSRIENRTERSWVVAPHRTTLDKMMGHFDGMLGMHRQQSLLMALAYIAAKKSVFADPWLEGDNPQIIQKADGLTGEVGIVKGGRITYERPDAVAAQVTLPMLSMLERNQRVTAGMPAQWGGEQPGNVRTGRGASELLSAAVDGAQAAYHRALAESAAEEAEIALEQAKVYWPNRSRSFHVPGKAKTSGDYTPAEDFVNTEVEVDYPVAGADAQTLTIMAGQMLGIGAISTEDVMDLHPLVKDKERTKDRIVAEKIERAALAGLEQQIAEGTVPLEDAANIYELVKANKKEWWQALLDAQRKAQERQAAEVAPGDPAAQPGLAQPGMGAEAGGGAIPGNGPEQADLATLLHQMHASSAAMGQ